MQQLNFETTIAAAAHKVWFMLWDDVTYRKWVSVFSEGSYAVSDWKPKSKVHFLNPAGEGIYSQITECVPNEKMVFKHIGTIKNFEEQPITPEFKAWTDSFESYTLLENNGTTTLQVSINAPAKYADYFATTFPNALALLKTTAETYAITVTTTVNTTLQQAWDCFNKPQHVQHWYCASNDWHCPTATNELEVGKQFVYAMAAKDGSFAFDFASTYTAIKPLQHIASVLADGRKIVVNFTQKDNTVVITETFDPETENSITLQQGGWQAILNNFNHYIHSLY